MCVYNVKNYWRIRRIAIICSNFPPLTTRTIPFFIFPIYNFLLFAQQHEICKSRTVNRAQIYNRPILTDTYRDHWTGIENDKARYTHERIHSVHTHTHTPWANNNYRESWSLGQARENSDIISRTCANTHTHTHLRSNKRLLVPSFIFLLCLQYQHRRARWPVSSLCALVASFYIIKFLTY